MTNLIYDVDLAYDVKTFILTNLDDIIFATPDIKNLILSIDDNSLIRVGKTINSPIKIVSVDIVDPDFFRKNLFKNGNKN